MTLLMCLKTAAIKSKLSEQTQVIAILKTNPYPYLTPRPTGNPLKPTTGFTQCGSLLGTSSVSEFLLEGSTTGESISPRFSAYLHSRFRHKIASTHIEPESVNYDEIYAM